MRDGATHVLLGLSLVSKVRFFEIVKMRIMKLEIMKLGSFVLPAELPVVIPACSSLPLGGRPGAGYGGKI